MRILQRCQRGIGGKQVRLAKALALAEQLCPGWLERWWTVTGDRRLSTCPLDSILECAAPRAPSTLLDPGRDAAPTNDLGRSPRANANASLIAHESVVAPCNSQPQPGGRLNQIIDTCFQQSDDFLRRVTHFLDIQSLCPQHKTLHSLTLCQVHSLLQHSDKPQLLRANTTLVKTLTVYTIP
ncbi:hypothetical protein HYQ45_009707 [Verticillium longisporum]|uniref:Uncharacterized protein n=1 Tax=Verticillium longisporum TaxID=100787 RepID=A0A8I2ZJG7_VERLO|nr:hypothetical protein HYQ45_009707 [Verticillium longisporum]